MSATAQGKWVPRISATPTAAPLSRPAVLTTQARYPTSSTAPPEQDRRRSRRGGPGDNDQPPRGRAGRGRAVLFPLVGVMVVLVLATTSLFVGVADVSPATLFTDPQVATIFAMSRVPRTVALVLAGASMAVAGTIMQMLARNRFTEPSTAGTTEFAGLGVLIATLATPGAPLLMKMVCAVVTALLGSMIFLRILRVLPTRNTLLVPLVGLMLGGVVAAGSTFLALRFDLLQSLGAWTTADFSVVISGRYELLWIVAAVTVLAYIVADRFTAAGLGETFATNLGLNYRGVMSLGLTLIAVITAIVVVTVGAVPFLGLIVPNLVSMWAGDNVRRNLGWTALGGAAFVLACDIIARVLVYPAEIPLGTVVGVLGAGIFLTLLLRQTRRAC